jgi:hypothetical protein
MVHSGNDNRQRKRKVLGGKNLSASCDFCPGTADVSALQGRRTALIATLLQTTNQCRATSLKSEDLSVSIYPSKIPCRYKVTWTSCGESVLSYFIPTIIKQFSKGTKGHATIQRTNERTNEARTAQCNSKAWCTNRRRFIFSVQGYILGQGNSLFYRRQRKIMRLIWCNWAVGWTATVRTSLLLYFSRKLSGGDRNSGQIRSENPEHVLLKNTTNEVYVLSRSADLWLCMPYRRP